MMKIIYIFVIGLMWINYPQTAYVQVLPYYFYIGHNLEIGHMNNQEEIWKDVIGYEGLYRVSSFGRMKSIERADRLKRIVPGIILKQSPNTFGYMRLSLYKNGVKKYITVHQIVAKSFLSHTPNKKVLVVNHIDFNRQNNNIDNLEIVTNRENTNQKHLKSSSNYTGVSWNKSRKKWISRIEINGESIYLGIFDNEIEACKYYEDALISIRNNNKIKTNKRKQTSLFKGVSLNKSNNKWVSQIKIKGERIILGYFTNELDAHEAYQNKKKKLCV